MQGIFIELFHAVFTDVGSAGIVRIINDLQFLLVEYLDQFMGNQLVKPLEESLELGFYGGCHFGIGAQLHVLLLVLFCYNDLLPVFDQGLVLDLSEVVKRIGEVQLQVVLNRLVLKYPFQGVEVLIIFLLHIEISDGQVQNMFVESRRKVGIQQVIIEQSLADNPPNKLEILQMLMIDITLGRRMESIAVTTWQKQTIIRVKHLP